DWSSDVCSSDLMANHARIAKATNLVIYFCDPHSPWQRGTNENANAPLRQYFPKGTDLSQWGPGYLDYVAAELNNRPRKRHHWQTPAEVLDQLLSQHDHPPSFATTAWLRPRFFRTMPRSVWRGAEVSARCRGVGGKGGGEA